MAEARRLAEQRMHREQAPRQSDPAPRLPALPPPQMALPIWQGVRRPATVALGGEQCVLPEELRERTHEAVAHLARQGKL